ncbi:tetratricopeptide repeat-containing sulfotransferase family protein [Rubritalea halochordaticola]|uniref:tetratricopeptide repeat-containing sulfotransferase family protein n=1 Tax=Rubritalea halochordaticola TaxID=714537 RepID=UPI0031FE0D4F
MNRRTAHWTEADLPELQQARYLWENDEPAKALEFFERAAKRHPRNLMALLDAARALGNAHRLPEASALLTRASRVLEKSPQGLERLGQSYRMAYMPDLAAECFAKAVQHPECLESVIELTIYHERRHQLDRAESVLAPALVRHPDVAPLKLLHARLQYRRGEWETAKSLYAAVSEDGQAHPYHRAQAYYELANLADKEEDYRGAYQYALYAKDQLRPIAKGLDGQNALWRERHKTLVRALSPELISSWQSEVQATDKTPVFLTGCPRSGTTLLERVLGAHPQIQSFDELDIFPRFLCGAYFKDAAPDCTGEEALESCPERRLSELRASYWRLFGNHERLGRETQVLLDKNPSASGSVPVFLKLFPHAKVLFATRDPRDISVSCFLRFLPMNAVSVSFLDAARTVDYVNAELSMGADLRDRMPAEQAVEVRYESVIDDLEGTSKNALNGMQLDWSHEVAAYRELNSEREVNSPTYLEVTQPIHRKSAERWKNYAFVFESHWDEMSDLLGRLDYA